MHKDSYDWLASKRLYSIFKTILKHQPITLKDLNKKGETKNLVSLHEQVNNLERANLVTSIKKGKYRYISISKKPPFFIEKNKKSLLNKTTFAELILASKQPNYSKHKRTEEIKKIEVVRHKGNAIGLVFYGNKGAVLNSNYKVIHRAIKNKLKADYSKIIALNE